MSITINVTGRTEEGKIRKVNVTDACYRSLGKMGYYIQKMKDKLDGADPVTLTHVDMADNIQGIVTPERVEAFSQLWNIIPALRTCISTPQEILSSKRATFDVVNYSLNEVMVALFFMRTLVNGQASCSRWYGVHVLGRFTNALDAIVYLTKERGWAWWKAYMFTLCNVHNSTRPMCNTHLGGNDAACIHFYKITVKDYLKFFKGEWEWNYCPKTYKQVLEEEEGYTQNMLLLVKSKGVIGSSACASKLYERLVSGATKLAGSAFQTDLFGGVISTAVEAKMDYVDAWDMLLTKELEKIDA